MWDHGDHDVAVRGNDSIDGGDGDDTFMFTSADDVVAGLNARGEVAVDGGTDGVGDIALTTDVDESANDITLGVSFENLSSGDGDDNLKGNNHKNMLSGGKGNDTLNGNKNNDTVEGGMGDDDLIGCSGADKVMGGDGDDVLLGGSPETDSTSGANLFVPREADGSISIGNAEVKGDTSADTLTGGDGADVFIFGAQDVIADFGGADNTGDSAQAVAARGPREIGSGFPLETAAWVRILLPLPLPPLPLGEPPTSRPSPMQTGTASRTASRSPSTTRC